MKASASNDPSMSQKNDVVELLRQGLSGKYSVSIEKEDSVTLQRDTQISNLSDQLLTNPGQSSTEFASTKKFIIIQKENQSIIKFPASFQQPSTEEAIKYSALCEGQIEEFYLDIFGLSDKGIKFKFSNDEEKPILSFDELPDQSKFHDFFKGQFRELCSVPVGRLLLYRLLIEIFRNQKNDPLNDSTKERDWNKTLKIIESEKPL